MGSPDVLVVGGGLHGCSAALQLARRGARVTVVEKDHVGRHASGVNAGGVRRLARDPAEIPLALEAMAMWHRIGELVDEDCGFRVSGQVMVAESEAELAALRRRAALVRDLGYGHEELIGAGELFALLPALAPHCVGGLLAREDGFADPARTTRAFRRKAESLGVLFREGCRVTGLRRAAGAWEVETTAGALQAAILVNCAGAWAGAIAAALGEPVPLEPIAPMMMVTERLPPFLEPVVIGTGRPLSFKQQPNGTVLIGGGHRALIDGERTVLDFARLAASAATVCALFPLMRQARVVRGWAGIEARMPDDIPVIAPSGREDGAFHAFGFSAHGFQLGPVVGRIIAELASGEPSSLPVEPFRIGRFADGAAADRAGFLP
jgi:sarcosine oxidase subunit beta